MATEFFIKPGYKENKVSYFLDDCTATQGIVFQPDVYRMAELLAGPGRVEVVDVGCGWGEKLAGIKGRNPNWITYGIDFGENIAHCRETYAWGTWLDVDLETVGYLSFPNSVIVCSDVIEHLRDPRPMLAALRGSGAARIVLSTPERDQHHTPSHFGPSPNIAHVREWNTIELHDFLTAEGFTIRFHGLTRGSDQGWAMGTQIVIME